MKFVSFLIVLTLIAYQPSALAANRYAAPSDISVSDHGQASVSEFVYQREQNEVLLPVYLLGAVNKPGLYHVPPNTDMFSLLALAGGSIKEAELDHVQIKRRTEGKPATLVDLDLEKSMRADSIPVPGLASNDVVYIPTKEPIFSNNTVLAIGVISSVVGVVLAAVLVSQTLKK